MIRSASCIGVVLCLLAPSLAAQEATIHHGFLFFAGEKYTVDEETYGIYEDGHEFAELIQENPQALEKFQSYRSWHITANVLTGLSLGAMVLGGVAYMPGVQKNLPENMGIYAFAAGGGLLLGGLICEFVSWGRITSAAETYNGALMDDGAEGRLLPGRPTQTTVAVMPTSTGAVAMLGWRF